MNAETQMIGERLAKSVAARTAALEIINSRSSPALSWWQYCLLIILGIGWGWLGSHSGPNSIYVLGLGAGVGFFLAVTAFAECIRLRKRLDATILLLCTDEQR